jgi:hypothetical protein
MVSKQEELVYERVLDRDRFMVWDFLVGQPRPRNYVVATIEAYLAENPWVCVASIIDPSQSGRCSGEMERDHVWPHTGGTKSKRPPTTMETVVILCHHHHQNGWATSHRPEIRAYIVEANERYRAYAGPGRS